MRTRSLLLAALAVAVVAPPEGRAAEPTHGTKRERVVVAPHAGQVVRSHHVRLRVRSRGLSGVLQARLNGRRIGDDFGRPRGGVRTLQASVSHGLRRGRNVLRVKVRRRGLPPARATVRFFVRTTRPLVGAGRDRRVVIGSPARLSGQLKRSARRGATLRWKLVGGPRRSASRAHLRSRAGRIAAFRPAAPGSYTLALTHRIGRAVTTDRVTLDAVPRSPLVPVDTMVGWGDPSAGIRVGDTTHRLRDAAGPPESYYQVLLLERKTLAVVWNRKYGTASDIGKDLRDLDDTKLVILVQQLPSANMREVDIGDLNSVVGRIGAPDDARLPKGPGTVSVIGVPGMARGDADVNVVPLGEQGRMQGYLSPDQYLNYGFVPSLRYVFDYGAKAVDPCTAGIAPPCDSVGYRLNVKHSRTFDARPGDNRVYNTGGRGLTAAQQAAEANRLADDLNAVHDDDVVLIQTVGRPGSGETNSPPPVGAIDKATMVKLAAAVARVGGSRDAFNRSARVAGVPASSGAVYMLAGWAGAREGEGAEAAAGVEGAGPATMLSFVLRPDRRSRLRPAQVTRSDKRVDALSALMLKPPTTAWPLDDDPGARKAIDFLAGTDMRLAPDPRVSYWTQPLDEAATTALAGALESVPYPPGRGFTQSQFEAAQKQLAKELRWVGSVRTYLTNLSRPFSENALQSWAAAETIGNEVYADVNKPDDEIALGWIEVAELILDVLGPITEDVTATLGAGLEVGVWAYGALQGGSPTDQEVRMHADELGSYFAEQARQAEATFARMGDVIVSDYEKLQLLGPVAGCNPSATTCPKEYALSTADRVAASADVYRSVRQTAYRELLPLAYRVFSLTRHCQKQLECERADRSTAPDPVHYACTIYHPWYGYPAAASTSLLQELDPVRSNHGWDTFVLSTPPGAGTQHGTPPSDELMRRAFGPVSRSGDPKAGGAGLSLGRLALDGDRSYWFGNAEAERASCDWDQ